METKITLDQETFKALAVDTRIKILKILDERQHTLTDLAEELGMAPSTIKEHLDKLVAAGLIKQIDKGMKWKYYHLTTKGKQIVNPHEKKVWIILAATLVALSFSVHKLLFELQRLVMPTSWGISKLTNIEAPLAGEAGRNTADTSGYLMENMSKSVDDKVAGAAVHELEEAITTTIQSLTTTTIPPEITTAASGIPYAELVMVIFFVLVFGICAGYLIKKKKII